MVRTVESWQIALLQPFQVRLRSIVKLPRALMSIVACRTLSAPFAFAVVIELTKAIPLTAALRVEMELTDVLVSRPSLRPAITDLIVKRRDAQKIQINVLVLDRNALCVWLV